MRRVLTSFVLGFVAVGALVLIGAFALGLLANANEWNDVRIAVGPVVLFEFERDARSTAVSFGSGLVLLALAGGALNAGAAALVRSRRRE